MFPRHEPPQTCESVSACRSYVLSRESRASHHIRLGGNAIVGEHGGLKRRPVLVDGVAERRRAGANDYITHIDAASTAASAVQWQVANLAITLAGNHAGNVARAKVDSLCI